jgi:hypothetical protein
MLSYLPEHFARDDDDQRRMYRGFIAKQGTGIVDMRKPLATAAYTAVYQPGVFICSEERRGVREGRRLSAARTGAAILSSSKQRQRERLVAGGP